MQLFHSSPPRLLPSLAALAFAGAGAGAASAQISFDPAVNHFAGTRPEGVAIGDWNGDGLPDVAATVDAPDRVVLLFNQGGGVLGAPVSVPTGAGTSPHALVAGDFDGDGDLDLAVTLKGISQTRILVNTGGSFALGASFATGAEPRSIAAGDLEPDGDLDLVVSNRDGNTVTIARNAGGGASFSTSTVAVGNEPRGIALLDVDLDGDLDAAVSVHDDRRIAVLTNDGASFSVSTLLSTGAQIRPEGLVAADLNGDGRTDLAAAGSGGGLNVAMVFLNLPGGFSPMATFATGGADPSELVAADLDGDGDVDLAVVNQDSNNVAALANGGAGSFGPPGLFAVGVSPQGIAAGDLDGNGGIDLVTANETTNDISVLLNQEGGPPAGPEIVQLTPASIGATAIFELSSPGDAGETYVAPFSGGTSPGILLPDGRVFPLNPDGIFTLSINPFNPIFQGTVGTFGGDAKAQMQVHVPALPQIVGVTVFTAFVVLDPSDPTGFGTISPALPVTIEP